MPTELYRYQLADAEATLVSSILAVEALHGEVQTRLDAGHAFDRKLRTVVIDASTAVGRDFDRLFLGFLPASSARGTFRVERVPQPPTPESAAA